MCANFCVWASSVVDLAYAKIEAFLDIVKIKIRTFLPENSHFYRKYLRFLDFKPTILISWLVSSLIQLNSKKYA